MTFGAEQVNIISHNTLRITGHFHSMVVAGTTLAFMGLTYYVVPLIWWRRIVSQKLALLQVYSFGLGIAIFAAGMTTAGSYAVPRRHWDVQFANALFQPSVEAAAYVFLGIMGLGGLLATLGGALYVVITVLSVFFGTRIPGQAGQIKLAS